MIHYKSCERCGGDIYLNGDMYGTFATCLQCGWTKDLAPGPLLELFEEPDARVPAADLQQVG